MKFAVTEDLVRIRLKELNLLWLPSPSKIISSAAFVSAQG